jgi:hypothetical protein
LAERELLFPGFGFKRGIATPSGTVDLYEYKLDANQIGGLPDRRPYKRVEIKIVQEETTHPASNPGNSASQQLAAYPTMRPGGLPQRNAQWRS